MCLGLVLGSQGEQKAKPFAPIISKSNVLIWLENAMLLWLVSLTNLILILFSPINIQWREINFDDVMKIKMTEKKKKKKRKKETNKNRWLEFGNMQTESFQTWYEDGHH